MTAHINVRADAFPPPSLPHPPPLLLPSGTEPIMTAHINVRADASPDAVLKRLEAHMRRIGITHSTIQICNSEGGVLAV